MHFDKKKDNEVHTRSKYASQSRAFLKWAKKLHLEKSFFGRLLYRLDEKFHFRPMALLFLFSFVLSGLMFWEIGGVRVPTLNSVVKSDIKSPASFEMIDEISTRQKILESDTNTPPVFNEDPSIYESIYSRIYESFRTMRRLYKKRVLPHASNEDQLEEKIKDFFQFKDIFQEQISTEISDRSFEWLTRKGFSPATENALRDLLEIWSANKIYDGNLSSILETDVKVVLRPASVSQDEYTADVSGLMDSRRKSLFTITPTLRVKPKDRKYLLSVAHSLLVPNIIYSREETVKRRKKAKSLVVPVHISIHKNETIVAAGSTVQPEHLQIINKIKENASGPNRGIRVFIISIILWLTTLILFSYVPHFSARKVRVSNKDLILAGTVVLISLSVVKLFMFLINATILQAFGDTLQLTHVDVYAAPLAVGAMLAALLITAGELVWISTLIISIAVAILADMSLPVFVMCLLSGLVGARGVHKCEKRNDVYMAGLKAGVIAAFGASLLSLFHFAVLGEARLVQEWIWLSIAAFAGALFSSMATLILVPIMESIFSCTTDLKLLELSNLNHKLIKDMMVKAPGTYHHALAVGNMVEEAASEIEANALMAKVMAYYHDIGKTEHAEYFIENQRPGYNPHEDITPYMSKTILIAHVKDGAELGLKYKLGKPIIDGILQHHGDTLISYFYKKALSQADNESDVEESDFRYPGPKPQFKEAGLVMLADSIEAAARSIEEPTASRLTHLVKNIIRDKFIDGQLAECDLSFNDLYIIERIFTKTLLSINHHRIDYEKAEKELEIAKHNNVAEIKSAQRKK